MGKRTRKSEELLEEKEEKKEKKEKKEKNPKKPFLLESILLSIIFILIGISIYLTIDILNKKEIYQKKIKEYEEKINDKNQELEDSKNKLDSYQNLDEKIENTKKEYFSYLSELEKKIQEGTTDKKIAYLTFDDGPYYNTYRVFDILEEYDVKATFFTTNINGEYCFDNKGVNCWDRYREYVERGHTIANHTYTHAIFRGLYSSTDSFMDAIINQENLIKEKTGGYVPNIVRFPGGSGTAGRLKDSIIERLRERGYGWVDWSSLDGDAEDVANESAAWNYLMNTLGDNIEVILFHDFSSITTNILPDVIQYLRDNGYVLLPLFYDSVVVNK